MYITFLHMYMFTCVFFSSDNDECSLGTHYCTHVLLCTNTIGSFMCGCEIGFKFNIDETRCIGEYYMKHTHVHTKKHNMYVQNHTYISNHVDIDECSDGTQRCSQICTNTIGSFTCGCNDGYLLDVDGATCNGMYKLPVLFW